MVPSSRSIIAALSHFSEHQCPIESCCDVFLCLFLPGTFNEIVTLFVWFMVRTLIFKQQIFTGYKRNIFISIVSSFLQLTLTKVSLYFLFVLVFYNFPPTISAPLQVHHADPPQMHIGHPANQLQPRQQHFDSGVRWRLHLALGSTALRSPVVPVASTSPASVLVYRSALQQKKCLYIYSCMQIKNSFVCFFVF